MIYYDYGNPCLLVLMRYDEIGSQEKTPICDGLENLFLNWVWYFWVFHISCLGGPTIQSGDVNQQKSKEIFHKWCLFAVRSQKKLLKNNTNQYFVNNNEWFN